VGQDGTTGIHSFAISSSSRHNDTSGASVFNILDPTFPCPSSEIATVEPFSECRLRQVQREESSPRKLLKHLRNMVSKPEINQIRTANEVFWNDAWITS